MIKSLSVVVGMTTRTLLAIEIEKKEMAHAKEISNIANRIVSSLSHKDLANRVREVLPSYTEF